MSQPAYAPDSRDGTGLLGPGQTSITVPGQAWAQLRYKDYVLLTGHRQLVNQGWVNPQDNRMIPNTFEGVTVTGDVGPVEYRRALSDDWRLRFDVQLFDLQSVGSQLLGPISTWNVGARAEVGWRGLAFFAMVSATGADAGIRSPYGAFPGYISLIAADFNLANEKAWEIGASYDGGGTTVPAPRVPGLWTTFLYAEGFSIKAQAQNVPVGKSREADLFTIYRPPTLPGFQFRFLASMIQQEPQSRLFYDFRIIMDYELPLF